MAGRVAAERGPSRGRGGGRIGRQRIGRRHDRRPPRSQGGAIGEATDLWRLGRPVGRNVLDCSHVDAYRKRIPLGNLELGSRLVGDYEEALAELRAAGVRVAEKPKRDIMTFGIGYSTDIHAILAWCRDQVIAAGGETTAGAAVTELIRDDGGAVTGVLVRDRRRAPSSATTRPPSSSPAADSRVTAPN